MNGDKNPRMAAVEPELQLDKGRPVYLAGPITAVGRERALVVRTILAAAFRLVGMTTFDPAAAWRMHSEEDSHMGEIVQAVDDEALLRCGTVCVAYMGVPSVGTDHEVDLAIRRRIAIIDVLIAGKHSDFLDWEQALLRDRPGRPSANLLGSYISVQQLRDALQ